MNLNCHKCSYTATTFQSLQIHERRSKSGGVHQCDQCDFKACFLISLEQHRNKDHCDNRAERVPLGKDLFLCDLCDYRGKSRQEIFNHISLRKGRKTVLKCPEGNCQFTACFQIGLGKHRKAVHGEILHSGAVKDEEGNIRYKCDRCSHSAPTAPELSIHLNARRDEPVLKCADCEYTACFKKGLDRHRRRTHSNSVMEKTLNLDSLLSEQGNSAREHFVKIEKEEDLGFKEIPNENSCGQGVSGKKEIMKHKCDRCSYSANSIYELHSHTKRSTNQPIWKCPEKNCKYSSCFRYGLLRHMRREHGESVASDFVTATRGRGEYGHNQEKANAEQKEDESVGTFQLLRPYKCDRCSYAAKTPEVLAVHVNYPHSGPVLKCSEPRCDFKSCFKLGMGRHKKLAHGESHNSETKIYACDRCSYTSTASHNLTIHMNFPSKGPILKCSETLCGFTSCFKKGMFRHMKSVHGKLYKSIQNSPEDDSMFDSLNQVNELKSEPLQSTEIYGCDRCSFTSPSPRVISVHTNFPRTEPVLRCTEPLCDFTSCFKMRMFRHQKLAHGKLFIANGISAAENAPGRSSQKDEANSELESLKSTKIYKCDRCSYTARNHHLLATHVSFPRSHPVLKCSEPLCQFTSCFQWGLGRHRKQSHGVDLNNTDNTPSREDNILRAINQKHQHSAIKCEKSEEEFQYYDGINKTSAPKSPAKIFKCDRCSYIAINRHVLANHVNSPRIKPLLKCSEPNCNYDSCFYLGMIQHRKIAHGKYSKDNPSKSKTFFNIANTGHRNSRTATSSHSRSQYLNSYGSTQKSKLESSTVLSQRKITRSIPPKLHYCDRCSYSSSNPRLMVIHKNIPRNKPVLKCTAQNCNYKSCFRLGLVRHMKLDHENFPNGFYHSANKIKPSFLNRITEVSKLLKPFKNIKSVIPSFPNSIPVRSNLKKSAKIFKCKHCSFSTNFRSSYYTHLNHPRTGPILKCPEPNCKFTSCFGHGLFRHNKWTHGKSLTNALLPQQRENKFSCPHCQYTCSLSSTLSLHMTKHRKVEVPTPTKFFFTLPPEKCDPFEKKFFSCPYCDEYTSNCRIEMGLHVKHHRKEDFLLSCQFCRYKSHFLAIIERHEKRHSVQGPWGCEVCGKIFLVQENLKRHELLHRNKTIYKGKRIRKALMKD